jgi:hypothetical protein
MLIFVANVISQDFIAHHTLFSNRMKYNCVNISSMIVSMQTFKSTKTYMFLAYLSFIWVNLN